MSLCETGILRVFMQNCTCAQAEMLTGCAVTNVEEARGAARELLRRGCSSVIVTLGPQGCVVLQAQGSTPKHVPTAATVTAVDTTVRGKKKKKKLKSSSNSFVKMLF